MIEKIIAKRKADIDKTKKIIILKKCFNPKDLENNYFLIGSLYNNKAIIIKISHDFKIFETIQTIDYKYGLIFSNELKYNNNYYLLDCYNVDFSLWYYDEKENNLKHKIIKSNINSINIIITENNNKQYRMIKYIKNLRMVIVLVVCNSSYLLFYEIDDKNKENKILNLKLIGKTTLKKEDNNFSSTHNNCCIINDKYLIIGSKYIDE